MNLSDAKHQAFQAGCRQFIENGKMVTATQFLRLGFPRSDVAPFFDGFETARLAYEAAGPDLRAARVSLITMLRWRAMSGEAQLIRV